MLFSDDESENSNVESDSKIPSVELAQARRKLQVKEKQLKKMRSEIMALYRINRRLNLKSDRLKGRGKYMKDPLKTSKGKKVKDQSDSEDIESGDSELEFHQKLVKKSKKTKSNAGQQYKNYPLKRSKGKKVVQDSPQSDQSDSEDVESGDSELELNPKLVKKQKKAKSNAGKQCITSMDSNVHSEQSNSEDYNSGTEQNDIEAEPPICSLAEQMCESNHPLVQEDALEGNVPDSKCKFFVL